MSSDRADSCWQDFDAAVARWRLGLLLTGRLPEAATRALAAGCDGDSLRVLAGLDGAGSDEIGSEVERVLAERGCSMPTDARAVGIVGNDLIRRMVQGETRPESALGELRELSERALDSPQADDLSTFHHLALDWQIADEAGLDRDVLLEEAMGAGRKVLERGGLASE
jgi:hypothetical protein